MRILQALLLAVALTTAPSLAQEDPTTSRGFDADKVFQLGKLDHVNVFNGNLLLTLPIGQEYPLGGGFSYRFRLVYNSNLWDFENFCGQGEPGDRCTTIADPAGGFTVGAGWNLTLGRLLPPGTELNKSSLWQFSGADGGQHGFYSTLHEGDSSTAGVFYSRDGSYLRMQIDGSNRIVERADGRRYTFVEPTAGADEWLLTSIDGPYSNQLTITYSPSLSNWDTWTVTDRYDRTHTISFEAGGAPDFPKRIDQITLEAFGDADAVYDFAYTVHDLTRSCPHNSDNTPGTVSVPLLGSITQPDGTTFTPAYSTPTATSGCSQNSARILSLGLPTLGTIEWTYQAYRYPLREDDASLPLPNSTRPPITTGVATRTFKDRDNNTIAQWTYAPELEIAPPGSEPNEFKVTVTDPSGNYTVNYFSADRDGAIYAPNAWNTFDYGLPFTRNQSVSVTEPQSSESMDLYLSTQVYNSADTLLRSVWVRYEMDEPGGTPALLEWAQNLNRRQIAERTVFEDDANHIEWFRSDFDGLGHHRREQRRGSFPASDANGRITFTNFNPDQGTYALDANHQALPGFTMWSASDPWILGTSSHQYVSEDFQTAFDDGPVPSAQDYGEQVTGGATYAWVETDYDPDTGFLNCRRRLRVGTAGNPDPPRDGADLLEVFTPDAFGNVADEAYYGGDQSPLGSSTCDNPPATAEYLKSNEWQYGALKRSVWMKDCEGGGEVLEIVDHDIDAGTGLVSQSRDAAGYSTDLTYDSMGRLLTVEPAEEASTQYTYLTATGISTGARVLVQRKEAAAVLTEQQFIFDDIGRLCMEVESRPAGTYARRMTAYNGNGWRTDQTEWVASSTLQSTCTSSLTTFPRTRYQNFDPFGRAGRVVAPDGSAIDFSYFGTRQVKRTASVATGANGTETDVETVERYDAFGRLRRVIEDFSGTPLTTSYAYEVNNNLRHVVMGVQERVFNWDKRGLLVWEQHPELLDDVNQAATGRIDYQYDSRGNVVSKDDGENQLSYLYDKAGRVTQVRDGGSRLLQEYFYRRTNSPGELSAGKLYQAKQHNYGVPVGPLPLTTLGVSDLIVTETYNYAGRGGRVSERTTVLAGLQARVFRQGFGWDALGNLETLSYPRCLHALCSGSGIPAPARTVTNVYDEGSLAEVSGYASSITYHPNGLLNRVTHANGMADTQEVDPSSMARPARITATGSQGSWNSGLYSYDGSGNITAIGGDVFVYDALNRLTSATLGTSASGASQGYAFDDYGNLTTLGSRTFTVNARTNRLTSASYDRAGNQLTSGSGATLQHYQFNALNRLSTHQTTSDARGFVYTVDGERLLEIDFTTDPWEEVWTIRDLAGRVLRQWRRTGDSWLWSKDYIYRGSRLLASEDPDGVKHFHLDHLGTPRLLTDGSGVVGEHAYFPFGEEVSSPGQNSERMKFTGHERDLGGAGVEDDLDYMHARYCSPMAGRFLSVDPKRMGKPVAGQSWNRYAYTEGNPLKYVDPDGRQPTSGVLAFERDARAVLDGRMTSQQFQERNAARAAGAYAGASLFLPGPEDVALGFAVRKFGRSIASRIGDSFSRLFGRMGRGANRTDNSQVLPRSGPIDRSLGAMSRPEALARQLKLNANSPTTRQVLNSLDDNVSDFVGKFRKGAINRELPGEVLDLTVEEALKHSSKVRKLLIDGRFVK